MRSIHEIKRQFNSHLPRHWQEAWLLFILQKPFNFLISNDDYVLSHDEYRQYIKGIEKMTQGTPFAYLTGTTDFWSLSFKVNEHTLIPRADTELLVEKVLSHITEHKITTGTLLDLGTGSGCIAISLAKELPTWHITATDRCPNALRTAQHNATLNGTPNITFIQSDWFTTLPATAFDVIVSNPPYIAKDDSHLPALHAEPITALVADNNGLSDIAHIISHSRQFLADNALLAIEHGYQQGEMARQLFSDNGFYNILTYQDYGANDRITLGQYSR